MEIDWKELFLLIHDIVDHFRTFMVGGMMAEVDIPLLGWSICHEQRDRETILLHLKVVILVHLGSIEFRSLAVEMDTRDVPPKPWVPRSPFLMICEVSNFDANGPFFSKPSEYYGNLKNVRPR